MPIPTLHFSEELPEVVRRELEQFVAQLRGYLLVSLNEDGSLRTQFNNDNSSIVINNETNADGSLKQRWDVAGPWTLDDPQAELDNVVGLRPPDPPAGTYHNYAPPGIDDAVCLEIEPTGNITLTGIKRMTLQARKRILLLRNRDSSATITLKHLNTGSLVGNRFDLPGNVDVVLDPGQNVWLYYDIGRAAWTAAITTQKAGGLNEGGASAGGDVSGPASAIDNDVAVFDGTTGKLIKDSGISITSLSGPASGANMFQATVDLGDMTSGSTTVTLAAAPGAGFVLVPYSIDFIQAASTDQFIQNAPINLTVKYSGITTALCAVFTVSNSINRYLYFRNYAADTNFGAGAAPPASTIDPHNQSIVVTRNANIDYTGGGGTSVGKFKMIITYAVLNVGANPIAT